MSKNDSQNPDDAADYLAQVDWQIRQFQRRNPLPWYMEPKWRYNKITSTYTADTTKAWRAVGITIAVVCAAIGYFGGIHVLLPVLVGILFFGALVALMMYDASKKPKDDD